VGINEKSRVVATRDPCRFTPPVTPCDTRFWVPEFSRWPGAFLKTMWLENIARRNLIFGDQTLDVSDDGRPLLSFGVCKLGVQNFAFATQFFLG
jgi:hypothetical protein